MAPRDRPQVIASCEMPRARCGLVFMTMSDAGWLALAVASGVLIAAAWVSRERAIHRRRRQRFTGEEKRE